MGTLRLALLVGLCFMLTSCPPVGEGEGEGESDLGVAKLTIHNECDEDSIVSIQFKGPTDAGYTPNQLDGDLLPGGSVEFELEAATFESGLTGDRWDVVCELSGSVLCLGSFSTPTTMYWLALKEIHASEGFDWYIDCSRGHCDGPPGMAVSAIEFEIHGRQYCPP